MSNIPGGYSKKKWVGVCGPLLTTLAPIYDQNLRFSIPYLWPDPRSLSCFRPAFYLVQSLFQPDAKGIVKGGCR